MKNKIVVLEIKESGETFTYPNCRELLKEHGKAEIGIGLGALWNGLSKGGGRYENKRCIVTYRQLNLQPKAWE